ncbi:DUF72 domain-containing protein [Paraburkholderia franconis]|uniref:DUF72 domain-containing protein n=1 Tax=Paraburkholderia franconis TaxID=2654983 RepID=UPI001D112B64|nr:DUF72 domain-containing protein [Paraburkholderia franconis]
MSRYDATPRNFLFSVKGPRYPTHMLRFRDETARPATANFFASGVLALREKPGVFLWQFPPNFAFVPDSFEAVLALLPMDFASAAQFAAQHDARVSDPWVDVDVNRRVRHAIEIRHPSFGTPEFVALLRKYKAALVISDSTAGWPYGEDATSGHHLSPLMNRYSRSCAPDVPRPALALRPSGPAQPTRGHPLSGFTRRRHDGCSVPVKRTR